MYVHRANSYFVLEFIFMGKLDILWLPQTRVLLVERIAVVFMENIWTDFNLKLVQCSV